MTWPRACAARIIATLESLYAFRDSSGSTMKRSAAAKLKSCGLLGLRHHEVDGGADLGVRQRRVAGLRRHRALAFDHPLHEGVGALLNTRRPLGLVAELRRIRDTGATGPGASRVATLLAIDCARLGIRCRAG